MPRIKLTQKGFESYTGEMGVHSFVGGLSSEMSHRDADAFGASMRCVLVDESGAEEGKHSPMNRIDRFRTVKMEPKAKVEEVAVEEEEQNEAQDAPLAFDYTMDSLSQMADAEGINGLRKIANAYEVRGTSISGIINDLMAKKAAFERINSTGQ